MKITVWKKYELNVSDNEIKENKRKYMNDESDYNFSDELDFMDYLEDCYDFTESDDFIIDKNQYEKLVERWNEIIVPRIRKTLDNKE